MPCTRGRNCSKPKTNDKISYRGTDYWLCSDHQRDFDALFQNQGTCTAQQKEDAKKLFIVTSSQPLFDLCMMALAEESAKRHGNAFTWRWRMDHQAFHLSKELVHYEYRCWFGEQQKIFAGLLSGPEFLSAMANGYMVKDPGPGPNHGEFSHRLQWHMLMRVMTADFTVAKTAEWHSTPPELYCWTGTSGYWGAALEGAGQAGNGPGSPAWVDQRLRSDAVLSKTALGRAIDKRRNKRLEMLELIAQKAETYAFEKGFRRNLILCHDGSYPKSSGSYKLLQGKAVDQLALDHQDLVVLDMHHIFEMLYAWKKTGGPKGIGNPNDHKRAIAAKVWNEEDKARGTKTARYLFEDLGGQNFSTGSLLEHSAQCTDGAIAQRIANSKGGLRA